jgi:sulfate adenylyltransferase large subunit
MSTSNQTTDQFTQNSLLRFTTAGSVDDGKSTLIGRLLYDCKSIFEDQLAAVEESSKRRGDAHVNLALLTDGLRAEREQGITIDVAYRYFATPVRKFIIADTPGHVQYTRNMVTGASTADLAIILVDARQGVIEQTRRHTYLASLLRLQHIVLAVNKMDLVNYDENIFNQIVSQYQEFIKGLDQVPVITPIPLSALNGDNVVESSPHMPWYKGETLLKHLETVQVTQGETSELPRYPVQWVIRPMSEQYHDFRGYAGRLASGTFKAGEKVLALPAMIESTLASIQTFAGEQEEASPAHSYTFTLEDEIDISRGDMIVKADQAPHVGQHFDAMICWFSDKKMKPRGRYYVRHTTREARAVIEDVIFKVDITTLKKHQDNLDFQMNDIGCVRIRTSTPLFFDAYKDNRITGSFVLVDEQNNNTVAAGMIIKPVGDDPEEEVSI